MRMRSLAALVAASMAAFGAAQINLIGPFSGGMSENFEGFPNYGNGGFYTNLGIMGGGATMSTTGGQMAIYQPGTADFGLGDKGLATVTSPVKGWGQDFQGSTTITFGTPVLRFGGNWNYAYLGGWSDVVRLSFYDTGGNLLGNASFTDPRDNVMRWHGWDASGMGIKSIVVSGDYTVADDLQADVVPEPATLAVIGAGVAFLARRRRK